MCRSIPLVRKGCPYVFPILQRIYLISQSPDHLRIQSQNQLALEGVQISLICGLLLPGGTPYNDLYGETQPEGAFIRLPRYKMAGMSNVQLYEVPFFNKRCTKGIPFQSKLGVKPPHIRLCRVPTPPRLLSFGLFSSEKTVFAAILK